MEDQELKFFRELLTNWLEDLLKQGDNAVSNMVDSDIKANDLVDQASLETARTLSLRLRDRERRLINKIRQSLQNLDDGDYGICEKCGEDISIRRLKARPVTTLCITCKNKMEALEKTIGH